MGLGLACTTRAWRARATAQATYFLEYAGPELNKNPALSPADASTTSPEHSHPRPPSHVIRAADRPF